MNLSTEQKQTHIHGEQTCGCQREGEGSGMDWEFEISRYKLLHLELISNEVLLYGTGNYTQPLGFTIMEDNIRKGMYIYMYVCLGHFVVQKKLAQHSNQLYFNKKFLKRKAFHDMSIQFAL